MQRLTAADPIMAEGTGNRVPIINISIHAATTEVANGGASTKQLEISFTSLPRFFANFVISRVSFNFELRKNI
jgi:hypothetical protein